MVSTDSTKTHLFSPYFYPTGKFGGHSFRWEIVVVARKLLIVCLDVFGTSMRSVEAIACNTLAVIFLAIVFHLLGRPYSDDSEEAKSKPAKQASDRRLHLAELFALATVWIILWAGILLYLGQSSVMSILLTILICLCMAAYTVGGAFVFGKAFLKDRRAKKTRHLQYQKMRAAGRELTFTFQTPGPIGAVVTDGQDGRSCHISELTRAKDGGAGMADKAGLHVGDWIVACGGKPVTDSHRLRRILRRYGRPIEIVVSRSNRRMSSFDVDGDLGIGGVAGHVTQVHPAASTSLSAGYSTAFDADDMADEYAELSQEAQLRLTTLEVEALSREAERDARAVKARQNRMRKQSSERIKERLRARAALRHSNALAKTDVFKNLPPGVISQIISVMDFKKIDAGQDVVTQGDPASSFIVIMKGAATVLKDGETVRKFGALDYLGEAALVAGDGDEEGGGDGGGDGGAAPVRGATVTSDTELQMLSLTRDRFLELLLSAEEDDAEMVGHLHSARNRAIEKRKSYSAADRERRSSRPQLSMGGMGSKESKTVEKVGVVVGGMGPEGSAAGNKNPRSLFSEE